MKNVCRLLLYFFFWQSHFNYVQTAWPPTKSPTIDLLGLFLGSTNSSQSSTISIHPKAMFKAAVLLSQQYNITIGGKHIGWQVIETGGDVMNCFKSTCRSLLNSSIVGVVGPAYSRETDVLATFAGTVNLPVISYSGTSTDLSDRSQYTSFFRTVSSDKAAALAIVDLFLQYNWTSSIIIYQNDVFGTGGARVIAEAFSDNNLSIDKMILFKINTLQLQGDLKSILNSSPTRIVILWVSVTYTNIVLQQAIDADVLGPHFTWMLSSNDIIQSSDETIQQKLVGLLILEPVTGSFVNTSVNRTLLNDALNLWKTYEEETYPGEKEINYYAYFAFDATWTLIKALEQYCSTMSNNSDSCISIIEDTMCFDRSLINGKNLIETISKTQFLGVSGQIKFSMNVTDRLDGIDYVINNVQLTPEGLSNVPVLVWLNSSRWQPYPSPHSIKWPGDTVVPPNGLASISDVDLRVAVYLVDPFTMSKTVADDSGKTKPHFTGYIPDLLDLLVAEMGFIPKIIAVPGNQSYNSLIDGVVNGDYDIVVADLTITSQRTERVSFSNSIFDNSVRVIVRKRTVSNRYLVAFLNPLSIQLWMVLLLAMIGAGILICLFEWQHNEVLQNRTVFGSIAMSIYYSFGNIVGYGAGFDVKTAAGRLVTVALYTLSIVIVATYTANLTSSLTIMKSENIVSGMDDIKNGQIPFGRVGILINSSIEAFYLREISDGIRNYYPLKEVNEIFSKLLNEDIDAAIMDAGILEYATSNIYCNLTLVGVGVDESVHGIVMPKNWLYVKNFDYTVLSLRESGALNALKAKWFRGTGCPNSDSTNVLTTITIESLSGLFLIFSILLILAIIVCVWETQYDTPEYILQVIHRMKVLKIKTLITPSH